MNFLSQIFTWWNGQTIGTMLDTRRNGVLVGEDGEGNRYYRDQAGVRRWVIFNGVTEATRVAPEWHGWLHHTWDETPIEAPPIRKAWEKPHQPNLTGTDAAYHPPGSLLSTEPERRSDYQPWVPGA